MADELAILVNRCLTGHQPSFHTLVERFRGQVFGLCYKMLGQREDAEDATQETMVRLVNNLHRWEQSRAFEPWLFTIAGNRCRTRLAKRKRRPAPVSLDYPIQDQSHLDRQAEWLKEELDLALSQLRREYRNAFLLFHEQELAYADIANRLEVPLGTVKTWVHRARREIITQLRKRETLGATRPELCAV
ncbi:MAG: RNA polymerase sigma factor [Planctomycetota bacterium]|nr:RNA polymerase sigma factor [Planctomycetota bacterium]